MSYILIDSETRRPVPLPYHTRDEEGKPVTVSSFYIEATPASGRITTSEGWNLHPFRCGLEIITEEAFMTERTVARTDKEA